MKNVLLVFLVLLAFSVKGLSAPPPLATPITGSSFVLCPSFNVTYSNTTPGGVWSSSTPAVATIDAMGEVTPLTVGTTEITYTVGADFATAVITVNETPVAPVLSGNAPVCVGSSLGLTASTTDGTWSSVNTTVATISATGEVLGVSAGTTTISYEKEFICATTSILTETLTVTVNAMPDAITGTMTVCPTGTEALSSTTAGGTWNVGAPGLATIGLTDGMVTGVAPGVVVVSYTVLGCSVTTLITVNALANPGGISGPAEVCTGTTISFTNTDPGGVWSSSDMTVASIGTDGVVSGLIVGTTTISYTATNACGSVAVTATVNVIDIPDEGLISGPSSICSGSTILFTNHSPDGVWSSSDMLIASIGTAGDVTGGNEGTATITYTVGNVCGSAAATIDLTVNPLPDVITGDDHVCRTFTTALTDATPGGTWSSTTANATIDATTGVVTGNTAGTASIRYTLPTGCRTSLAFTVNPQPVNITGTPNVCDGATRTLINGTAGGAWSSTDLTVDVNPTTGSVTGLSLGTAIITYTLPAGCFSTTGFTVNPTPGPISGAVDICAGSSITLTNTLAGGTWTSSNTGRALVNPSTGVVLGYMAGSAIITYRTTGNCISTVVVSVIAAPAAITGTATVCEGSVTTLANTVPFGVWISDHPEVAEVVVPTGIIGGVTTGTSSVSYALANGCYSAVTVTVNPLPAVITGIDNVCTGRSISLTSAPTPGTWSSPQTTVTVAGVSGIVTGMSSGTAAISYMLPTGCRRVHNVTVNPSPTAIAGTPVVCEGMTTLLSSTPGTGSWSSGGSSTATIASTAGVVTGIAAGTVVMTYALAGTGCSAFATVTVNPAPSITSPASICMTASATFTSTTPGGTWSSADADVSVGATSGLVTGVAVGTAAISYEIGTGCINVAFVTINPLPSAGTISGSAIVCVGGVTTLGSSIPGGTWSAVNGSTSVSAIGVVSGLHSGIDTVIYSVTDGCGTATAIWPITVTPMPSVGIITGPSNVCIGAPITLANGVPGGTWSNASTTVATVNSTGEVSGIVPGTAIISYTTTNSCGAAVATAAVNVLAKATAGTVTGAATECISEIITLTAVNPGGSWISTSPWIAAVNTAGKVTGMFPGTTTIMYIMSNACSADTTRHDVRVKTQLECETSVQPSPSATAPAIKLYPNPTNGALTIASPVAGNLAIYAIDGREVAEYKVTQAETAIVLPHDLAAGVYMCRFTGNEGSSTMVRLVYKP